MGKDNPPNASNAQYNVGVILGGKTGPRTPENMPPWPIFHFLRGDGKTSEINDWLNGKGVPAGQRAELQSKISTFESGGPDLSPGFIVGPIKKTKFYKMKIKASKNGWVQLRPVVCKGPFHTQLPKGAPPYESMDARDKFNREHTMLVGAIEKNSKLHPETWETIAGNNLSTLLSAGDNNTRRARCAVR